MTHRVTINLAQTDVIVPEGTYAVEVMGAIAKESAAGGVYLSLGLNIAEGKYAGTGLWAIASLRDDMRRLLRSTLAALGVDVDSGEVKIEWEAVNQKQWAKYGAELVSPELVGQRALAVVVHDEWEGELRAKVRRLIKEQA